MNFRGKLQFFLTVTAAVVFILSAQVSLASGGGGFVTGGSGYNSRPVDREYNVGKSIVRSRKSEHQCRDCHKKFKRKTIKALEVPVSAFITNCELHAEKCFDGAISRADMYFIDYYFNKRYRLKKK